MICVPARDLQRLLWAMNGYFRKPDRISWRTLRAVLPSGKATSDLGPGPAAPRPRVLPALTGQGLRIGPYVGEAPLSNSALSVSLSSQLSSSRVTRRRESTSPAAV